VFTIRIFYAVICLLILQTTYSQQETITVGDIKTINPYDEGIDPLSPSRAAFYSAVLPGLGQAYNKKYWKIPLVYAVLGTSIYAYNYNRIEYKRYRDAYKSSVTGKPHEFDGEGQNPFLSDEGLQRAQKKFKEDRDLTVMISIGLYALQIIEASVNAHLMQMNTIDSISFNPNFLVDPVTNKFVGGFTVSFKY
jgi:hypothetical protein